VLATPCTAPFLGAALGFAFVQPSYLVVLFFVTIALGLALPYLLLSWNPAWLKFLPKPGAWMERFKVLMGFPMLATAVWLFTLTETFYGNRIWWLGAFLVIVALCAWMYGEFVQRGRTRRTAALVIVLVLLGGSFAYAIENKLQWRTRVVRTGDGLKLAPKGIPWERWSPENVAKARAEGRPVIVDFTAEWCITCNTVMKPALESDAVQARMKGMNVAPLLADNTTFPPEIAAELERYGRAGVPMLLVFPKDPSTPAIVVSEAAFYTTQASHILKALDEAEKGVTSTGTAAEKLARTGDIQKGK
jgi:thiol:disulfide interchange protein DsbD